MKFRTEIVLPTYPFKIDHEDKVLLVGSCFSDHIGKFFERSGFTTLSNPFGVLFNPYSIALALQLMLHPDEFSEDYIDFFNNQWISFAHHGKFSHPDKEQFLQNISDQLNESHNFIKKASTLFITLGTSYYYYHIKKQLIVSNCHKIPGYEFEKKRIEVQEIVNLYEPLIQKIKEINPNLKVVFTVSPVRHLGDGFHENQLSKAILHISIDQLVQKKLCHYFPAYEIVQDDLRDYRFYADDLCHIAENGVNYIAEKVTEAFFSKETMEKMKIKEKEYKARMHRQIKM